jgi:NAD(P)-dependent dehydrogenase (short-subunit alcohol dehydrogenase family)
MPLKSAIITGASSGIGRALAIELASAHDLEVIAIGRRKNALDETASHKPGRISPLAADITNTDDRSLIESRSQKLEPPVCLFHGAGYFQAGILSSMGMDEWQASFNTNVSSRLALTQILLPILKNGRVLFIGSDAAQQPRYGAGAYSVAQAASDMLSRCLTGELKDYGISVASFKPGLVASEMVRSFLTIPPDQFPGVEAYKQWIARGEISKPETIAAFASWLLMKTSREEFSGEQWDVRQPSHHKHWLKGTLYQEPGNL